MSEPVFSVTSLNEYVKNRLSLDPMLKMVSVKGEISDYKVQLGSGHAYFTLKDSGAIVACTMWRTNVSLLRFVPKIGKKVVVKGQVTIYVAGGKYQLVADSMSEEGTGDLFARFEELKNRLMLEGLFDTAIKKPLPLLVDTIGVATSISGAAIRDIIKVARARNPKINIIIAPCAVQGKGAELEIANAVDMLDRDGRAQVILVGRGGGSMEDLWAFNEEAVARAIFRCSKPVISCVGHETDFSIADFTADVRASTPSNAAELAVADVGKHGQILDGLLKRLKTGMGSAQAQREQMLSNLIKSRVFTDTVNVLIEDRRSRAAMLYNNMTSAIKQKTLTEKTRSEHLIRLLETLNPDNVKKRGYAVVRRKERVVSSVNCVDPGSEISVELMDGQITAEVNNIRRTETYGTEAQL